MTIGLADGSIIATIITAHIVHISRKSPPLQADVIGMASAEPIEPIDAETANRYAQHRAVITASDASTRPDRGPAAGAKIDAMSGAVGERREDAGASGQVPLEPVVGQAEVLGAGHDGCLPGGDAPDQITAHWLDENMRVVEILHDFQPCPDEGDCPSASPMRPSRWVLEVAAGVARREGLAPGDRIDVIVEPPLP